MEDYDSEAVADFITEVQKLTPYRLAKFWAHIQKNFPILPGPTHDDVLDGMLIKLNEMDEWAVGNSLQRAADVQRKHCHDVIASWWLQARKADAQKEALERTGGDLEGAGDVRAGQVSSDN